MWMRWVPSTRTPPWWPLDPGLQSPKLQTVICESSSLWYFLFIAAWTDKDPVSAPLERMGESIHLLNGETKQNMIHIL